MIFTIYHLLWLDRPDGLLPISTSVTRSDWPRLLWRTNRKSRTRFRLVPKSWTLS